MMWCVGPTQNSSPIVVMENRPASVPSAFSKVPASRPVFILSNVSFTTPTALHGAPPSVKNVDEVPISAPPIDVGPLPAFCTGNCSRPV